jgi:hypothetical protein
MAESGAGIVVGGEVPVDLTSPVLVACCQAASSVLSVSRSAMRRSRHWRTNVDSSISAMVRQDPSWGCGDLQALGQTERSGRVEGLVEGRDAVSA